MKIFKLVISRKRHNSLSFKTNNYNDNVMGVSNCITPPRDLFADFFSDYHQNTNLYFTTRDLAFKRDSEIREALQKLLGFMPDLDITVREIDVNEA